MKDQSDENLEFILVTEKDFLEGVVTDLFKQKIQSVIVEGGRQLLTSFIKAHLWDEARIFISSKKFEQGVPAPDISGVTQELRKLDNDWLKILIPRK